MPDPVVTETTDIQRAVLRHLRASAPIAALVAQRVANETPPDDWPAGQGAILIRRAGGGNIADVRHQTPRYDLWALGSSGFAAAALMRRIRALLLGSPNSFKQDDCVVYSVRQEGGESYRDPEEGEPWYAVIQAFVFEASEVPL